MRHDTDGRHSSCLFPCLLSDPHARTRRIHHPFGDESQDMVLPQTRLAALEAREDYADSEVTVRLLCCNQNTKQSEVRETVIFLVI